MYPIPILGPWTDWWIAPWIGPWYVAVPDELIDLVEVNPGLIPVSEQAQLHSLGNL